MNPITNPFAPGAGTPPPELAGRDELRQIAGNLVQRVQLGLPTKSLLLVGLRGVGKTVLLDRIRLEAEEKQICTLFVESPENRSLPAMLAPRLRVALQQLSRNEQARDLAQRALRGLISFAGALKIRYADIEVSMDVDPEPGLADNGDLETDLQALLEAIALAAQKARTAFVIFIDELQYVRENELAALISALHYLAQKKLPLVLLGAGLPQLRGRMGQAKSYAERLFEFRQIGPLSRDASRQAIRAPMNACDVEIDDTALNRIVDETQGYPYFLQEWGKHTWDAATRSPVGLPDVIEASRTAIDALDASFFRVRFDRLTPAEKRYMRAMAALGAGPHRSGDIAEQLRRPVTSLGPVRSQLIAKGMIWSPSHGDTAFTVPLFDAFMCRIMPGDDWRTT